MKLAAFSESFQLKIIANLTLCSIDYWTIQEHTYKAVMLKSLLLNDYRLMKAN